MAEMRLSIGKAKALGFGGGLIPNPNFRRLNQIVRCDTKLDSILLGGAGFLTKPCVSPQVLHGSMRRMGGG